MFKLLKTGVIDYVTVEASPRSKTIVERFLETGWDDAIVVRDGCKPNEGARQVNNCCAKYGYPVFARTGDGKLILERMR